jgi:hypothetical protein
MGDKPLMKNTTLLILSATILASANLSVKQIENMVLKIHQKRPGTDVAMLDATYEPFAVKVIQDDNQTRTIATTVQQPKDTTLQLHAIMGNRAFINNKWLEVNATMDGYQLKYIGKNGVVLQNGNTIKKLIFNDKKNSLIKLEGR